MGLLDIPDDTPTPIRKEYEYDIRRFYYRSKDPDGSQHSVSSFKVYPWIGEWMQALVDSPLIPLNSRADVFRDAVYHRYKYLQGQNYEGLSKLEPVVKQWEVQVQIDKRIQLYENYRKSVKMALDQLRMVSDGGGKDIAAIQHAIDDAREVISRTPEEWLEEIRSRITDAEQVLKNKR